MKEGQRFATSGEWRSGSRWCRYLLAKGTCLECSDSNCTEMHHLSGSRRLPCISHSTQQYVLFRKLEMLFDTNGRHAGDLGERKASWHGATHN
jgi:hypothetical protein